MKKQFSDLIDVKSIVTIMITTVWCYLAVTDNMIAEVQNVFLIIVGFFFGTQYEKHRQYECDGGPRL